MLIGEEVAVTQITGMSIRVPQSAGTAALPPPCPWPAQQVRRCASSVVSRCDKILVLRLMGIKRYEQALAQPAPF
jgi:hypothetical protein